MYNFFRFFLAACVQNEYLGVGKAFYKLSDRSLYTVGVVAYSQCKFWGLAAFFAYPGKYKFCRKNYSYYAKNRFDT